MFSWLRRPKVVASLAEVDGPTRVQVSVQVAGGDSIVSPGSGVQCVLVQWGFYYGTTSYHSKAGASRTRYRPFRVGLLGGQLQLVCADGRSIRVNVRPGLSVDLKGDPADMQMISPQIASFFPELVASSDVGQGQFVYNESLLLPGDRLRFEGMVARAADGQFEAVEVSHGPRLTEI